MDIHFTTDYKMLLERIDQIDPIKYGKTRNYLNGDVTLLSPYISRGVISTQLVLKRMISKGYKLYEIELFVKEHCWRDYFQLIGQEKNLNDDIRQGQSNVLNKEIPFQIVHSCTGIEAIDTAIQSLYRNGYMHNHLRMYTAFMTCNVAKSHWLQPARWMYYHLLDGDWASNVCSWQWVAGTNSNKKYITNQENINKYTGSNQTMTYLDTTYENIEHLAPPPTLQKTIKLDLETILPESDVFTLNPDMPTFIYNYYNLDPNWHLDEEGQRVLLIEPAFFNKYPVSQACMEFMLALGKNISNIKIFVGSFAYFKQKFKLKHIYFKEHPLNIGYLGNEEPRDWIVQQVKGYYPSFFGYWKSILPHLKQLWNDDRNL